MKRFVFLDQPHATRFLTFSTVDSAVHVIYLTAKQGQLERREAQQTMSKEEQQENLAQAFERGFAEIAEADFEEAITQAERRLRSLCEEQEPSGARFAEWATLDEKLKGSFQNNPEEYLAPPLQTFCFFDRHAELETLVLSFDELAPTAQTAQRNLVFTNGLTVRSVFDAGSYTSALPLFVLVIGDLHVHNLILTCWAEVVVTGNLIATGTIFGFDGETGGRLKVHGNVTAAHILSGSMYAIEIDGTVNAPTFHLDNDTPALPSITSVPTELSQTEWATKLTPLSADSYFEESSWATGEERRSYTFNPDHVIATLREKRDVFR